MAKSLTLTSCALDLIDESRTLRNELGTEIEVFKGDIDGDTTERGKVYRFMDGHQAGLRRIGQQALSSGSL